MSQVVIQSSQKLPDRIQISPPPKTANSPKLEQIDSTVNSSGRKIVGQQALEKAISNLTNMFSNRNISVSKVVDVTTGMNTVHIQDKSTGKTITSMPPEAVVQIAQKAKENNIGLLLDSRA